MRIGIEAQRIFRKKKHGMDIVALELIKALQQIDTINEYFIFVKKGEDSNCLKETPNFKIVEVPGVSYADWEQIFLPLYAHRYKVEILHCTSNTAPVASPVPTVITLHDVIFLENKKKQRGIFNLYQLAGKYYRKVIVPTAIRNTDHIITVSHYEKEQINNVLQIAGNKISVVYNSFGTHFRKPEDQQLIESVKKKYHLPDRYIFYIGNTDPKKNMFNTIQAYSRYAATSTDPISLVIADVKENIIDQILAETGNQHLKNHISLTGYIYNNDLPLIYAGARLFLYPSLRESFGIPVLESMACGTPVITSGTSALPEIAGNAALLVNPTDINSISGAITDGVNNETLRNQLIQKGFARTREFSWIQSAKNLLHIYQTI